MLGSDEEEVHEVMKEVDKNVEIVKVGKPENVSETLKTS
jgi:hypothetical protein